MFVRSGPDLGRLVRGVIAEQQKHILVLVHRAVDTAQELQEFPDPMTRQAFTNHASRPYVERREQCCRAVAFVIMGHLGSATLLQRWPRLRLVPLESGRAFVEIPRLPTPNRFIPSPIYRMPELNQAKANNRL